VQAPSTHDLPAAHAVPHAPQFAGSESNRTHALPQAVNGAVQVMPHLLPLQTAPPLVGTGQAVPHAPQSPALLVMSTHAAAQDIVPIGHRSRHWPPKHVLLAPHFTPHAPQLFGSMLVAMQALPHRVRPALQLKSQVPRAQTATDSAGAVQLLPQAPQFVGSAFSSTHAFPQRTSPVGHALLHAPAEHVAEPALGLTQAWVHEPQCAELDFRSTQAPVHSVVPAGHTVEHLPAAQTCPDGHVVPQAPQWEGSLFRSMQAPLHAV
jgi:hypothetical protein